MPRVPRNEEEVKAVKDSLLQQAVILLSESGFDKFSMRRLASRCGMTATNLYYYFKNKDHIYLEIQRRGFSRLAETFAAVRASGQPPLTGLTAMGQAYLAFALQEPDQYHIMFNQYSPKYTEYVGTEMQDIARLELETALDVLKHTEAVLLEGNLAGSASEARTRAILLWSTLHGTASLINSRILQEVEPDIPSLLQRLVEEAVRSLGLDTRAGG